MVSTSEDAQIVGEDTQTDFPILAVIMEPLGLISDCMGRWEIENGGQSQTQDMVVDGVDGL
jgi:hypothetical protein